LLHKTPEPAATIILQRRSAQRFDRTFTMERTHFDYLLDCLLERPSVPWDLWRFAPRIHPLVFVHRVEGLRAGLYILIRRSGAEKQLRQALGEFCWEGPDETPPHIPFFLLHPFDGRLAARTLNCHQAIAADGCCSLAMLSEFEPVVERDPWRYRQIHWEAGLLGHILYLEAEALSLRGTGIGCYFDDGLHQLAGLRSRAFASLYHFTIGRPLMDDRILTLPPYPDRNS
jgi:hypothetical protein